MIMHFKVKLRKGTSLKNFTRPFEKSRPSQNIVFLFTLVVVQVVRIRFSIQNSVVCMLPNNVNSETLSRTTRVIYTAEISAAH